MKKCLILILFVYMPFLLLADIVDNGSAQYYGKVVYLGVDRIDLKEHCTGKIIAFDWTDNVIVRFNSRCNHPGYTMSRSPAEAEVDCVKGKVFKFFLKKSKSVCYATEFSFDGTNLHIVYAKDKGEADFNVVTFNNTLEYLVFQTICESDVPEDFAVIAP